MREFDLMVELRTHVQHPPRCVIPRQRGHARRFILVDEFTKGGNQSIVGENQSIMSELSHMLPFAVFLASSDLSLLHASYSYSVFRSWCCDNSHKADL